MARLKEMVEHEMTRSEWREFKETLIFTRHYILPGGGQIISIAPPSRDFEQTKPLYSYHKGSIEMSPVSDYVYVSSYDAGLSNRIRRFVKSSRGKHK